MTCPHSSDINEPTINKISEGVSYSSKENIDNYSSEIFSNSIIKQSIEENTESFIDSNEKIDSSIPDSIKQGDKINYSTEIKLSIYPDISTSSNSNIEENKLPSSS